MRLWQAAARGNLQRRQPRVPDAGTAGLTGLSGGRVVREGSVGVWGKDMVDEGSGVVVEGVARSAGARATGGPILDAGAVGSAAAGKPGVWAKPGAPAIDRASVNAKRQRFPCARALRKFFMLSPCVSVLAAA